MTHTTTTAATSANILVPPTLAIEGRDGGLLRIIAPTEGRVLFAMAFVNHDALSPELQAFVARHAEIYPDGLHTYHLRSFALETTTDQDGEVQSWDVTDSPRSLQYYYGTTQYSDYGGMTFNGVLELTEDFLQWQNFQEEITYKQDSYMIRVRSALQMQTYQLIDWLGGQLGVVTSPPAADTTIPNFPYWMDNCIRADGIYRQLNVVRELVKVVDKVFAQRAQNDQAAQLAAANERFNERDEDLPF